jgi:hypothetical protein
MLETVKTPCPHRHTWVSRLALAALLVSVGSAGFVASPASANGSLQVSSSPDPIFGKPLTLTVQGATPGPNPFPGRSTYMVNLVLRSTSQTPCEQHEYDDYALQHDDAVFKYWDVSDANGPFTRSYAPRPTFSGSPDSIQPGTYRLCAWLYDIQADASGQTGHGLISMQQSVVTVREPHFSIALQLRGPLVARPFPGEASLLKYTPLVARITAEVARNRGLIITVLPPGLQRCPPNLQNTPYERVTAVYSRPISTGGTPGMKLRQGGPFSYQLGLSLVYAGSGRRVGARPGRSLLCAGIYDGDDSSAPAGEEAAAHEWATVK